MSQNERLHAEMQNGHIGRLITKLAIPNSIGLLVIAAYSLADSFFVASLGTDASAAVGVCFSLHVLIQAVGYTLGMGAGSLLARAIGRRDTESASRFAALSLALGLLGGILITAFGLPFSDTLLRLLGARGAVLPMARAYVRPFLWSAPAMCAVFVFSQLLRAEGKALYSMTGLVIGSLLNILLDPLLITGMGLGIAGAAIATLISQVISACVLLSAYLRHKSMLSISPRLYLQEAREIPGTALRILTAGLPSLFRQGLSGLASILLNHAAATVSDGAVAGMSLVSRVFLLVFSLSLGLGQGMMPVVGYHRGAGNPERMKEAFVFTLRAGVGVMLAISIPLYLLSPQIIALFGGNAEATSVGAAALRAQSLVLWTHGIVTPTILYLQAEGRPFSGTVLAAARQGIFFLPLIACLPSRWGLSGLEWTQPLADLGAALFALPFLFLVLKNLKKERAKALLFYKKA